MNEELKSEWNVGHSIFTMSLLSSIPLQHFLCSVPLVRSLCQFLINPDANAASTMPYGPHLFGSSIPHACPFCQGPFPHPFCFIDFLKSWVPFIQSSELLDANKIILSSIISGCSGWLLGWLLRLQVFLWPKHPKRQISNSWDVNVPVPIWNSVAFEVFNNLGLSYFSVFFL